MQGWIVRLLRPSVRVGASLAMRMLPPMRHIFVAGWPDDEGNSVEVARGLRKRYRGKIFYLQNDSRTTQASLWGNLDGQGIVFVRRNSLKSLFLFASAEVVFFTHGFLGSPRSANHKTVVNLWHGDGPKRSAGFNVTERVMSDLVISGASLWGNFKLSDHGRARDGLLLVGNPRIDQFAIAVTPQQIAGLGLDPEKSIIVWMPTYRETIQEQGVAWKDAPRLFSDSKIHDGIGRLADASIDTDWQIVVKPHPLDAESFGSAGLKVITDDDLRRNGVGLYPFIGAASGLITDYSSVWTDYLALNRPIAFYAPDLKLYESRRGFTVTPLTDYLPGRLYEAPEDLAEFADECARGADPSAVLRGKIAQKVGAVTALGATDRLLKELDEWLVNHKRRPIG